MTGPSFLGSLHSCAPVILVYSRTRALLHLSCTPRALGSTSLLPKRASQGLLRPQVLTVSEACSSSPNVKSKRARAATFWPFAPPSPNLILIPTHLASTRLDSTRPDHLSPLIFSSRAVCCESAAPQPWPSSQPSSMSVAILILLPQCCIHAAAFFTFYALHSVVACYLLSVARCPFLSTRTPAPSPSPHPQHPLLFIAPFASPK